MRRKPIQRSLETAVQIQDGKVSRTNSVLDSTPLTGDICPRLISPHNHLKQPRYRSWVSITQIELGPGINPKSLRALCQTEKKKQ